MNTSGITSSPLYLNNCVERSEIPSRSKEIEDNQVPVDAFESSENVTQPEVKGNSLRYLVSFGSKVTDEEAKAFIEAQRAAGNEISELPLIHGYAIDCEVDHDGNIFKTLPRNAGIALDKPFGYINPLAKNNPSIEKSELDKVGSNSKEVKDVSSALIGIQDVWDMGYNGAGQTIAIIDSGIYPHPDLEGKIVGWVDMHEGKSSPVDTYGHGTHVAGIAAGSGIESAGVHKGVAPGANLVGVRISNVSEAIKGIQWVIENKDRLGISVINMSLGDLAYRSYKDDPWAQAAGKAMEAGLIVCVAAGNDGPGEMNISTPGIHPDAITVGALDDKGTIDRSDDEVASFSSRGPTSVDGVIKPDLLAPGVNIFGPLAPDAAIDDGTMAHDGQYIAISGTSMATPMVAGLSACIKQANPNLTQKDVKEILMRSCDSYLEDPKYIQGAGLINAKKAIELALSWDIAQDVKAMESASPQQKANTPQAALNEEGFLMA